AAPGPGLGLREAEALRLDARPRDDLRDDDHHQQRDPRHAAADDLRHLPDADVDGVRPRPVPRVPDPRPARAPRLGDQGPRVRDLRSRRMQPGVMSALLEDHASLSQREAFDGLDELRAAEYGRLDATGDVYLDYTGGSLYAESQVGEHMRMLRDGVYGNPHSVNPTSAAATAMVERARSAVLRYFHAPDSEYACIFTP